MSSYAISTTLSAPFESTLEATRAALAAQGFGVLTEIDVRATMKEKLDVDVPAQMILGACRPQLAHQALAHEPSLGVLLPCNVVVRATGDTTVVEAMDPAAMVVMTGNLELAAVADEARARLVAALDQLSAG